MERLSNPHFHRQWIIDELKKIEFDSLLEVGCGDGENLYWIQKAFPNVKLAGIDTDDDRMNVIRTEMPSVEVLKADVGNIPFDDKSFDIVLSDAVLMYVREINPAINEIERVAKKAIILSELNTDSNVDNMAHFKNYKKLFGDKLTIIRKIIGWGAPWDNGGALMIKKL